MVTSIAIKSIKELSIEILIYCTALHLCQTSEKLNLVGKILQS